jgi:transcriptional regulator with XRE-family HTH domain
MAVAKKVDFNSDEYYLGQRIKKRRKELGYSQTQLADLMDMDRSAISNYENGSKGEMGFKTLQRFATALGVTTSELLGETIRNSDPLEGLDETNRKTVLEMIDFFKTKQQNISA